MASASKIRSPRHPPQRSIHLGTGTTLILIEAFCCDPHDGCMASSYHPSLPLIGIGSSHRVVLGYFMCCERQPLGREMIPMSQKFAYILVCGLLALLFPLRVQAFQVSSPAEQVAASDVTPIGSFCRLGFHRSPYGHCVHNDAPNLYPPSAYAAPVPAAPLACSYGAFHLFPYSGCFAPACPYGYYLGPYGQCFPYWRTIM